MQVSIKKMKFYSHPLPKKFLLKAIASKKWLLNCSADVKWTGMWIEKAHVEAEGKQLHDSLHVYLKKT